MNEEKSKKEEVERDEFDENGYPKRLKIYEGYDIFLDSKKVWCKPGTVKAYEEGLKNILNYFHDKRLYYFDQLTTFKLDNYVRFRKESVSNTTLNTAIRYLKYMIHYLESEKLIPHLNISFKRFKQYEPIKNRVKKSDVIRLLKYFEDCNRRKENILAFKLILTTGIRTTELINIINDNVDLENKRILLTLTKTDRPRYIVIQDEIFDLVKEIKSKKRYLLNNKKGQQMTQESIREFFRHLREEFNIKNLSPSKLRHYYATEIYVKTFDIYYISRMLGHTNIHTTEKYLDLVEQYKEAKSRQYNIMQYLTE